MCSSDFQNTRFRDPMRHKGVARQLVPQSKSLTADRHMCSEEQVHSAALIVISLRTFYVLVFFLN